MQAGRNVEGIQPGEERLLAITLSPEDRQRIPTNAEMHRLFQQSKEDLDGEVAFNQTEDLLRTLFRAGDDRFTEALMKEETEVIGRNLRRIARRYGSTSAGSSPCLEALMDSRQVPWRRP